MKKVAYLFAVIILAGCGNGDTYTAENGTVVTYLRKGEDKAPSDSLISYLILKYETLDGNVIFESTLDAPTPIKIDSNFLKNEGDFFEIIGALKVGDSTTCEMTASALFLDNFKGALPDSVAEDDLIRISTSFLEQVSMETYQRKAIELQKEQSLAQLDPNQMAIDIEIIDKFLAENGLEAETTEAGVRYIINEQGDGPKPELGENVAVHYAGRLLSGEYFDTSMEEVAKAQGLYTAQRQYQPYPIQIWSSPVISGWHDGISQLNEGTKATLYIPSPMAYGPRDRSDVIVANSILVFDVELVKVN